MVTESEHPQEPIAPLLHLAFGALTAQVLYVAVKLGLAHELGDGQRTTSELSQTLGVDVHSLRRVLRGLVSLGVCTEIDGDQFGLTALGQYLRADHPDSVQSRVLLNGEVHGVLWADLLATVRTGESASQRVFGTSFYDYLARNTAAGALFDRAMTGGGWVRYRFHPAIDAYDFGQFATIVDVGGGNGTFLVELLKRYPRPTGTVFDVPRLGEAARRTIEAADLKARCTFVGGDAFESVPANCDAYLLSNFLIGWGDDEALVLLRNCRNAVAANGKLLLVEWIMPTGKEPKDGFRFWDTVTMDLIMLAAFGSGSGHVRTRSEFEALLGAAGFRRTAVIPTRASVYVIEAVPV
ncbi:MAG TPA: methyltransferase [Methylococcus sp.]|nr:methyltransferase [Methylococcus sp.]